MSALQKFNKKYRLKDGSIYWHKLYFNVVPKWMTKYSPPGGHYNYASYLIAPYKYAIDLYDVAKWFLQRGRRGYADCDVWNWNSHMAKVNVAALRQLARKRHGHPIGMTMGGWRTRLLRMADGFQAFIDEDNDTMSYRRLSRRDHLRLVRSRQRRLRDGLRIYAECFPNLWD